MKKVIYFSTQMCAPCKALKPTAQEVSAETGVPIEFVDAQLQSEYARTYGVSTVPTLIGIRDGNERFRHTGMTNKPHLSSLFSKV